MNARELKMSPAQLAAEQERQRAASRARASRVKPKRAGTVAKKKAKANREAANRAKVYRAVDARSDGVCEYGDNGSIICMNDATEHDHFWGRGKEDERADTVWHLCNYHHTQKTNWEPSRLAWLRQYRNHCFRNGYHEQQEKCDRAIALESAQHPTPAAGGTR